MKNIDLLGIKLNDRTAGESLFLSYRFLNEGSFHTILYLTTAVFLEAVKNEEEKEWIASADLTLWGDTEILKAVEVTSRGRYREVREREFLQSFLKGIAKTHKSVLVLSDTEERAEILKQELLKLQDGITVVKTMMISATMENRENIINEINMVAPTVIMARMPFSLQRRWLAESKPYMNAVIWIGFPEHLSCIQKKEMPIARLGKQLLNVIFHRQVSRYKK